MDVSRKNTKNKLNQLHKRALRISYSDYTSSFEELLYKDNSVSIHHRSIQKLATEIYKVKNGYSNILLKEFFIERGTNYNLRDYRNFTQNTPRTSSFGLNSITYFGPIVWSMVPEDLKSLDSLSQFNSERKSGFLPNVLVVH